ncbi:hypothetical protein [Actinobacillus succinogenes]
MPKWWNSGGINGVRGRFLAVMFFCRQACGGFFVCQRMKKSRQNHRTFLLRAARFLAGLTDRFRLTFQTGGQWK